MKKIYLVFFVFVFSTIKIVSFAQDMCFRNDGLKVQHTVSFTLVGNKITEGSFGSWNYDRMTSGEEISFIGTKSGNTLTIKFTGSIIPYDLPPNTKKIVWTLKNNVLLIPTYGKNYDSKKYAVYQAKYTPCEAVKDDHYEENVTTAEIKETSCACNVFVTDPDKNGLNVRNAPERHASIVAKIPYNDEGTILTLVASSGNGWVKTNKATDLYDKKVLDKTGWIAGNKIGINTKGYNGKLISLYREPNMKSGLCGSITAETPVSIIGCEGDWLKIKYKQITGWLSPSDQCDNPVTNCN